MWVFSEIWFLLPICGVIFLDCKCLEGKLYFTIFEILYFTNNFIIFSGSLQKHYVVLDVFNIQLTELQKITPWCKKYFPGYYGIRRVL